MLGILRYGCDDQLLNCSVQSQLQTPYFDDPGHPGNVFLRFKHRDDNVMDFRCNAAFQRLS